MTTESTKQMEVTIRGETYVLPCGYRALMAIEAATGMGLLPLCASARNLSAIAITLILHRAAKAGGAKSLSQDDVAQAVFESFSIPGNPLAVAALEYLGLYMPPVDQPKFSSPSDRENSLAE